MRKEINALNLQFHPSLVFLHQDRKLPLRNQSNPARIASRQPSRLTAFSFLVFMLFNFV